MSINVFLILIQLIVCGAFGATGWLFIVDPKLDATPFRSRLARIIVGVILLAGSIVTTFLVLKHGLGL